MWLVMWLCHMCVRVCLLLQWLIQMPLVALASVCGGLLGCVFNKLKSRMRFWRRNHSGLGWRLAEAAAVGLVTAATLTGLPALAGTCLSVSGLSALSAF